MTLALALVLALLISIYLQHISVFLAFSFDFRVPAFSFAPFPFAVSMFKLWVSTNFYPPLPGRHSTCPSCLPCLPGHQPLHGFTQAVSHAFQTQHRLVRSSV